MGRIEDYRKDLRALPQSGWADFLTEHSGLPGPRGNLELAQAVADEGDLGCFDEFIASGDEYLTVCGVVGLGRLLGERPDRHLVARLHRHATDGRWRVREAVAMALQRLGDADLPTAARPGVGVDGRLLTRWSGERRRRELRAPPATHRRGEALRTHHVCPDDRVSARPVRR